MVTHLADGLRANGHQVKIITPKPAGYKVVPPPDYILLGTSTKFNYGTGTTGTLTFDILGKEVKELFETERFDVINFHEPWAPIMARLILPHSSSAHVGTFHANLIDSIAAKSFVNMFKPYGRSIGNKMQVLTAVSFAPASVLIDKLDKSDKNHSRLVANIRYIPNGIDLKQYKPPKVRIPLNGEGTKTVVYVGRLERRKCVEYLVKAFELLVEEMPNVHLIVAGKGGKQAELERLVQYKKIPNVEFLGFVSEDKKKKLLANADLVCVPAMYGESFGIVLVEAMAMGSPVIAGANIGYKSVMTGHGRIGLVDAEAIEDFANRMAVFLSEPDISKMMRSWGIKEAMKYEYDNVIKQYEDAYKEAIRLKNDHLKVEATKRANENQFKKIIRRLFVRR